jgi:NarL family two-component system response regulator LiaR
MGHAHPGGFSALPDTSPILAGLSTPTEIIRQPAIPDPIRVMVVDDHELIRSGLVTCLTADEHIEVVGQAASGLEAIEQVGLAHPDIILMDLVMPGIDGVKTMQEIRSGHPDVRLIVLTAYADRELVQTSLKAGASGYLLKDISVDDLVSAIQTVCAGNSVLTGEVARLLAGMVEQSQQRYSRSEMTAREQDVLELLVEGQTNRQIALRLGLSVSTVKTHVSYILSKLNASSRAEAVALYLQHNRSQW